MNIAIIGTGISGMLAARLLCASHRVSVFEAGDYIGGHTATKPITRDKITWDIDTGFIVHNEAAYPHFIALMEKLGVATQPAPMSFSVKCEHTGVEYCSSSLNAFFAQRGNVLRPAFWRMTRDIMRFNREAPDVLKPGGDTGTLGAYLDRHGYSRAFLDWHILPLGAAIWSTDTQNIRSCPVQFFVRFFANHGFLQIKSRSKWRTVQGGSYSYIEPLVKPFRDAIRLNAPIQKIKRFDDRVQIALFSGETHAFDHVIIATHSYQALGMLADPSGAEREILSAIPYQASDVVLHTDTSLLPKNRRAWACWNYHILSECAADRISEKTDGLTTVTYNMNMLQNLKNAPATFCVTLNRTGLIDPKTILRRYTYAHPLFTPASVAAQARHAAISGVRRTHYCGAYWGYGFHEDGVNSALKVAAFFGKGSIADV
jgi:predicted NAD/FAD-binding protein